MPESRRRLVTHIAITWHYEDEPGTPHTDTLTNETGGEDVDGLIWSPALMNRVRYDEPGGCGKPERRQGKGQWKVRRNPGSTSESDKMALTSTPESYGESECFWMHREDCVWTEYCPDE